MVLRQAQPVLEELRTLKGASLGEQARIIQLLAERNLDLYEALAGIVRDHPEDGLFSAWVSGDRERVVLAALLAILGADIASLPCSIHRTRGKQNLTALCCHLHVQLHDVLFLVGRASQLEILFGEAAV